MAKGSSGSRALIIVSRSKDGFTGQTLGLLLAWNSDAKTVDLEGLKGSRGGIKNATAHTKRKASVFSGKNVREWSVNSQKLFVSSHALSIKR